MDPLTWLLVSWIAVCGVIFFVVQHILPIFIPPGRPLDSAPVVRHGQGDDHEKVELRQQQLGETSHAQSTISSWASSAIGVVKGIGKSQQGESCEWVNTLLTWLHRNIRRSPDVTNAWLRAMNDASNKLAMTVSVRVVHWGLAQGPGAE